MKNCTPQHLKQLINERDANLNGIAYMLRRDKIRINEEAAQDNDYADLLTHKRYLTGGGEK